MYLHASVALLGLRLNGGRRRGQTFASSPVEGMGSWRRLHFHPSALFLNFGFGMNYSLAPGFSHGFLDYTMDSPRSLQELKSKKYVCILSRLFHVCPSPG